MNLRIGPHRFELTHRYVRTNRKRRPLVRLRFLLALSATLPLLGMMQ